MTEHMLLANQLLIAMPTAMPPYNRSVIYVCEHHEQGTVGLIINQPTPYPVSIIFDQLNIQGKKPEHNHMPLLFGGPLQPERGFVIHRPPGHWRSSLTLLKDNVTITTSNDIIRAVANNTGPEDVLIALGYVGWTSYQLEQEIMDNAWLVCPFKPELLFSWIDFGYRYESIDRG
jgi:putative transcriptional regulator